MNTVLSRDIGFTLEGRDVESRYTSQLLRDLGASVQLNSGKEDQPASNRWQDSGLAALTGHPDNLLETCPVPVAAYGDGAFEALRLLSGNPFPAHYRGADLMSLRGAMSGDTPKGNTSIGGSCRFLHCADGLIALNLPRSSDWDLLDAWLLDEVEPSWEAVESRVSAREKSQLLTQGRLLGLAVADAEPALDLPRCWYSLDQRGTGLNKPRVAPLVIDLSSLWAGPLCGQLLRWAGAKVLKVESSQRPDGARLGSPDFFHFLNQGKEELTLDLHKPAGRNELRDLIASADMVIEASRPRALRQMGIIAEDIVAANAGMTWISITGYGRQDPEANWVAFGDDAGVAGGLSATIQEATGQWLFCGDAIADPLTGIHAALAGLASWRAGGGCLLSLSLVRTVENCVLTHLHPQCHS